MSSYCTCCYDIPQRWVVCLLCSVAVGIISYKNRCVDEILHLTVFTDVVQHEESRVCPVIYESCRLKAQKKILPFPLPTLFWNTMAMNIALKVKAVGNIVFHIPAGYLADTGRAHLLLAGGILVSSITSLLMSAATFTGFPWYLTLCFVDGLAEATIFPCSISLAGRWAPVSERSSYVACVVVGWYIGDFLGLVMFKVLCVVPHWQTSIVSSGACGVLWFVIWYFFVYDSPTKSPLITYEEYCFISPLAPQLTIAKVLKAPWTKIFTSVPFLSLLLIYCAHQWLLFPVLRWITYEYQREILRLSPNLISASSAVLIASIPATLLGGFFSDWIVTNGVITRTSNKKYFSALGVILPPALFIIVPFLACNWQVFAGLYVTALFFHGFANAILYSNPVDLSPRFAGSLMGILNCVRLIFSMVTARMHNIFIKNTKLIVEWGNLFRNIFVLTCLMSILFFFSGSGDQQPWNRLPKIRRHDNPRDVPMNILDEPRIASMVERGSRRFSRKSLINEVSKPKKRVRWVSDTNLATETPGTSSIREVSI